jgi:hypothetical protein
VIATSTPVVVVPTPRRDEQNPSPGSIIAAGQAFTKGGINVAASRELDITPWDTMDAEFVVYNGSDRQIVVQWKPSYIRMWDNTGREYFQEDQDRGTFHQLFQTDLSPGESCRIYGYQQVGYLDQTYGPFEGPISPEADYLVIHIDQIAGLSDLNWRYDIR